LRLFMPPFMPIYATICISLPHHFNQTPPQRVGYPPSFLPNCWLYCNRTALFCLLGISNLTFLFRTAFNCVLIPHYITPVNLRGEIQA
jgi:hypothetical protein